MESILNIIANADKFQLPLLIVLGYCGFVLMGRRMDRMEYSLNKKIDGVESSLNKKIDDLRHNDLAAIHKRIDKVEASIEALTFALEKNGSLKKEDKEYIGTRLAI